MIWSQRKGWIGVDLGTHAVKLAQVERTGNGLRLAEALVIRRREPWANTAGNEQMLTSSSEEIRASISLGANFSGRRAAVTLPMSCCDVRECTIGPAAEAERRLALQHELDLVYGDAKASREFDYWPIDRAEDGPAGNKVIALSISRQWGNRVALDLSESGLAGEVLDGLPLAMARAVQMSRDSAVQSPVAVLDWGCRRATFCVVQQGVPYFVRCLRDVGFSTMIDALGTSLAVTPDEAQKLLTDYGLPNPAATENEELQGVIEEFEAEHLHVLVEELTRTLEFLAQQRRRLLPQKMLLLGGGATIKNVGHFLAHKLEMPVQPWQVENSPLGENQQRFPLQLLGPAMALSALAFRNSK